MNNKQRSKAIIDILLEENAELKRQVKILKKGQEQTISDKFRDAAFLKEYAEENTKPKIQWKEEEVPEELKAIMEEYHQETPARPSDNEIIFDDALVEIKCIEILATMQDHATKAREYYLRKFYPDEEAGLKKHIRYIEAGVSEILRLTGNLSIAVEETTMAYMKVLKELVVTSKEALIDFYHPVQNARLAAAESIKTFFKQKREAIERKLNEIEN